MTTIEAQEFLRRNHPDLGPWMAWNPLAGYGEAVMARIPVGREEEGSVGRWNWRRVPSGYPTLPYWYDFKTQQDPDWETDDPRSNWTGLISVKGPGGRQFFLFSFLSALGSIGQIYMVSTLDKELLAGFYHDVAEALRPRDKMIRVMVFGDEDIRLSPEEREPMLIDEDLRRDIADQVGFFFRRPEEFRARGIRHRRGLLFVGPPGTGKTMMVRRLIRMCAAEGLSTPLVVKPAKDMGTSLLDMAFKLAAREAPSMLVLEDLDSFTRETQVTRAAFLSHLDGIGSTDGILVLGTTNHPEDVDPALIHRPSRFDRVWHFGLPGGELRRRYLEQAFPDLGPGRIDGLGAETEGWSFAYLNELRTTAILLSLGSGSDAPGGDDIEKAHGLLATQFRAGRKNHVDTNQSSSVGFRVA
jgi:hypothetical protein